MTDGSVRIDDGATVGVSYRDGSEPPSIGDGATIRSGTVIYDDVVAGERLVTGHHALIRERTTLGDGVLVGTQAVVDGHTVIGDGSSLQTGAYVPRNTEIGARVFLGPNATLLNDPYPVRTEVDLVGPAIGDDVGIGANATVLPEVSIGERAFVAAGAIVTSDVPPDTLAIGCPATFRELPQPLQGVNDL